MPHVTGEPPRKRTPSAISVVALLALVALAVLLVPAVYPVGFVAGNVRWAIGAFYSRKPTATPQGFSYSQNAVYGQQVWTLRLADAYYVVNREDLTRSTLWMF